MLLKLYLSLVAQWLNWIKKVHYWLSTRKHFLSQGFDYWQRDSMSEWWVRLFDNYLYDGKSITQFLHWLDEKGKKVAQRSLRNITLIAQNNYLKYSELYDHELIEDQKHFSQYVLKNKGKYFPNFDYLYLTNDYYMKTLDGLTDHVDGKAILDCGAYIGDTAVPFAHKFPQSTVYAFEPEAHNYSLLLDTIEYNKMQKKIIPIKAWVGDQNITTTISDGWAGAKVGEGSQSIEIVTIDSYASEEKLTVGMIKWDIEWFEYESIIGAEKSIKKDKPVLIISLYHRGKDFFEIKELLESWDLGYKFTLRKRNCFHPFADTVLICH